MALNPENDKEEILPLTESEEELLKRWDQLEMTEEHLRIVRGAFSGQIPVFLKKIFR